MEERVGVRRVFGITASRKRNRCSVTVHHKAEPQTVTSALRLDIRGRTRNSSRLPGIKAGPGQVLDCWSKGIVSFPLGGCYFCVWRWRRCTKRRESESIFPKKRNASVVLVVQHLRTAPCMSMLKEKVQMKMYEFYGYWCCLFRPINNNTKRGGAAASPAVVVQAFCCRIGIKLNARRRRLFTCGVRI